jgi:hypothetical protein
MLTFTRWILLFRRRISTPSISGDVLGRFGRPSQACQVWSDFGTAHLSETKHEQPSPLVALAVHKARA